ncbi:MAG TPA: tetraacyldisaccharide 4'-kinase [Candidatus Krumholzibacteriaceae bacterium]
MMKIVERYPVRLRMFEGAGAWALLYPARLVLAAVYRLCLAATEGRTVGPGVSLFSGPFESAPGRPVVVSVGNLEVGGGGKTPCALRIARGIIELGGLPVVVSRGYGRVAERRGPCVVPAGRELRGDSGGGFLIDEELLASSSSAPDTFARAAEVLGDEILLYRERGIPVVIDPDRMRGAALASRLFAPSHIILDDAFQNRSIRKDVEILLLDAEMPYGNGRLLPAGALRESPPATRRADAVIFTRAHAPRVPREAEGYVQGKRVFFASHEPVDLLDRRRRPRPRSYLEGRECVLFSGIARPRSFEEMALSLGARPRAAFRFADHHRYTRKDVHSMLLEGSRETAYVTTEKDWAKAQGLFPGDAEVLALRIEMRIEGFEELLSLLASPSF